MNIAFICSEVAPFAKTGGLADVAGSLPRFLARHGHDVRVFAPLYASMDLDGAKLERDPGLADIDLRLGDQLYRFSVRRTSLAGSSVPLYLVHCPALYGRPSIYTQDADEHLRFALLCRAAIESCQRMAWRTDVFHCHDWHTGLLPLYLRTLYAWDELFGGSKTVLTIHNIGYQGVFGADVIPSLGFAGHEHLFHQEDLHAGRVNFLKTGLLYADHLTTVSPTYAREIQTEGHGMGLDGLLRARANSLSGILNGVDYDVWSPQNDRHLACRYSEKNLPAKGRNKKALLQELHLNEANGAPVLGMITRLTPQKGLDLLTEPLPELLSARDLRMVVLGSGEERYERWFAGLEQAFPGRVRFYRGYHETLAHRIEAGADMFLMPSLYEPCGLNQMYSLRYGTVPIVRRTGGLADSVVPFDPSTGEGTGFVFDHFTTDGLRWALGFALETWGDRKAWRRLMRNGMAQDFSWEAQAMRYGELYESLATPALEHTRS